ncbi:SDR family NAD(P)-dependent oxidoreductase [Arenicellales bacterium IMCC57338]
MRFDQKKILVTGGSRGIGRAIATRFAAAGAHVAIHYDSNHEAAGAAIKTLEGTGHILCSGDVAEPETTQRIVRETVEKLGGLDVLVNNAGIFEAHPVDDVTFDDWQLAWQHTLAVNLTGPANLCWQAIDHMRHNGGGRIINVSSRGAFRGEPRCPAYGASKAGLNAMTQSLAQRVAPYGIFVGAVAPGFVETDMASKVLDGPDGDAVRQQSPLGRVAKPEEVAHAVLFLASAGAEFSTGTIIDVNGASYLRS